MLSRREKNKVIRGHNDIFWIINSKFQLQYFSWLKWVWSGCNSTRLTYQWYKLRNGTYEKDLWLTPNSTCDQFWCLVFFEQKVSKFICDQLPNFKNFLKVIPCFNSRIWFPRPLIPFIVFQFSGHSRNNFSYYFLSRELNPASLTGIFYNIEYVSALSKTFL